MHATTHRPPHRLMAVLIVMLLSVFGPVQPAQAQVTAFKQAVAEAAARDEDLAAFYRERGFEGIWSGADAASRRNAFLAAMSDAPMHGLPRARYDSDRVMAQLRAAATPQEQGRMEVEMSRLFLQYARDIQTGILVPGEVVPAIRREVPYRPRLGTLRDFAKAGPAAYLRALAPSAPEYQRLVRAKLQMEAQLAQGGFGPTVGGTLEPGDGGSQVVALRNRLIAMGFLGRTATQSYDAEIEAAVQRFQQSMGLEPDGVVGRATLDALNVPMAERLQSILVAMERERWLNRPRGERHIWVNLTDYSAAIVDNDAVTFRTRSVIGATASDRQSPEFSDVMEHMVINPSWYVPRSIIVNEYLPQLRQNPYAVNHIEIADSRGRVVNRGAVNFAQYSASNFPFSMRQPPSPNNALGLVKFMFPNPYAIYLHDTPAKHLFGRDVRAFSHGCIRLNDPFDFAYELLSRQTDDPQGFFQSRLSTGREQQVNLEQPVPVHLVYRTAFTDADGGINYRADIYGRDARIWEALAGEGVEIRAVGG